MGELEKEREEAVQRLQVSLLLTQLVELTTLVESITSTAPIQMFTMATIQKKAAKHVRLGSRDCCSRYSKYSYCFYDY